MRCLGSLAMLLLLGAAVSTAQESVVRSVPGVSAASSGRIQSASAPVTQPSRADSYWYGRFEYGTIADRTRYGGLGAGFGRRLERNALAVDIVLFSGETKLFGTYPANLNSIGGIYTHAHAVSLLTLKGLYLVRSRSRTTPYLGGGAGWRTVSFSRSFETPFPEQQSNDVYERWRGSGIEGQFTVGYALARAETSTRFFVQVDLSEPLFRARRYSRTGAAIGDRHVPALTVSLGVGW